MSVEAEEAATTDVANLARLFRDADEAMTPDAAEALLRIRFEPRDLERIRLLLERHRDDALSPAERAEMQNDRRVSYLLDLMHSRARSTLKKHRPAG